MSAPDIMGKGFVSDNRVDGIEKELTMQSTSEVPLQSLKQPTMATAMKGLYGCLRSGLVDISQGNNHGYVMVVWSASRYESMISHVE